MGLKRRLPNSDDTIKKALNKAVATLAIVLPAEVTLTAATQARLALINASWNAGITARDTAMAERTAATALVDSTKAILSMFNRHYIMVFNMGVERGKYKASDRAYYHLPVSSDALPEMGSEDDLILWGGRIVTGDANRASAGGAPMENPTAGEVSAALTNFTNANNAQTLKEAAYKATLTVLNGLRAEAEAVVLKVWDETETFYNELDAPAKRDKGREWGIVYISDTITILSLTFVDAVTHLPISDTSTYFVEGDTTHEGNPEGFIEIKTTAADLATLKTTAPGYAEKDTVITYETGVHEYTMTINMVAV